MAYQLLSVESDAKTVKGAKYEVLTGILYLAPATEADGVHNLCPMSTQGCRDTCLYKSGRALVFKSIIEARIRKTLEYLADAKTFTSRLQADILHLISEARRRGLTPAVRVNGTSDLPKLARQLARLFPEVQFYDYTKIPQPWKRVMPNYHLTFSFSGENLAQSLQALKHGVNVSVVFQGAMPATWHGFEVINGDDSDLRFLDRKGVIVGLKAKGAARKAQTGGFIQIGKA